MPMTPSEYEDYKRRTLEERFTKIEKKLRSLERKLSKAKPAKKRKKPHVK